MNPDAINREFYNSFATEFDKIPFETLLPALLSKYMPQPRCEILEIGSGAGALAQWLTEQGATVTCLEPAEKPAQYARQKGLNVIQTTFQDYQPHQAFDVVIAISSLIHIPKRDLPHQLHRIAACLKPGGLFVASFILGEGEGLGDPTQKGKPRFFSKLTDEEIAQLIANNYTVIERHVVIVKKMNDKFLLLVLKQNEITGY